MLTLPKAVKFCGITLAATLNTPMSEVRPATMDQILVIEHDRALQRILQRLFSSEGHEVDVVPGGVAGLEVLRQRPPSVVVLDLPYADSSGDLCRKIATLISGLPLVVLSASSECCTQSPSPGNGCRRLRDHTVQPKGTC